MIPCTTFVWSFSFSSTCSFNCSRSSLYRKKVSHSNTHVESKNQNTKRRMETQNIPYFYFWMKKFCRANSMKKASSMNRDSNNLSKPYFDCYFCRSLVNFKNLIILFWNIWIIYGPCKSWSSIAFDSENIKNDS